MTKAGAVSPGLPDQGAPPAPAVIEATTPTVGYWQTKLAAVVGSARPSDIEASRLEWSNRARDLRTVQETLVHAIPDVRAGLNTESGVESVGAMRRAAARALARAERMERAESALVRVRAAIEEARAVLTPLEQTQIYEPLKGAPPVDGWESPQGIRAAARFQRQHTQFQQKAAEREEAARLALVALNQEFLEAGKTLEGTHSGATPDRPPGYLPAVSVAVPGVISSAMVNHYGRSRRQPSPMGRGPGEQSGGRRGRAVDGRETDAAPVAPKPVETLPIMKAPVTPVPAVGAGECGELPEHGQASTELTGVAAPHAGGVPGGVSGGALHGGAPALGGLMAGGLLHLFGRAGSGPAKPLEPTPLAKDATALAKPASAAGSRPFAAAPYAGRGMGGGMGMGMGGGDRSGGRGGGRRTFGNMVRATPVRRGERDRRNPFEREEERDDWLGDEGAGTGVLG